MSRHADRVCKGWVARWMVPIYDGVRGMGDVVYGPLNDLEYAFQQARTRWPGAQGWSCDGEYTGE